MSETYNLTIRHFTPEDAQAVADVIAATARASNAHDYSPEVIDELISWYSPEGLVSRIPYSVRLVAEVTGDVSMIVGTGARRENQIEGFFVHPEWQGNGIGAHMLRLLEIDAQNQAIRAVWLESSLTAEVFYLRQGYLVSEGPHDSGAGLVVTMRKQFVEIGSEPFTP